MHNIPTSHVGAATFGAAEGAIQAKSQATANLLRSEASPKLKEAFQDFVGQTFFSQLISAARSGQKDAPYFHGGQAEKIFQSQLDQVMSEEMSDATGKQIAEPMLELFMMPPVR